jgi:hypothetical protein
MFALAIQFQCSHFLQEPILAAVSFYRQMAAVPGVTSAADYFPRAEMSGHWQSIPESMPMLELLVAEYYAARDRQQPETIRNPDLGQHHRLDPDGQAQVK